MASRSANLETVPQGELFGQPKGLWVLAPQIKSLYADGDPRETDAFQYYSMAILIGVFIAPIVTGGVAALYGWHAGFGVAGVGMVIGLVVYLAGSRHLPPDGDRRARAASRASRRALTPRQRQRVAGLFLLLPVCILFWTAQTQVWNVYNVWVRDNIDMTVGGFDVPVPWLQSLDGLAPAVIIPLSLWLWASMAARERPVGNFRRMIVGLVTFGVATFLLSTAPVAAEGNGRASILLPVAFHVVSNLGFVWFHPTMVALFATRSPDTWRGTMLGFNSLAISAGSLVSGRMGALYETVSPRDFWLVNAGLCFAGAAILLVTHGWFRRILAREAEEAEPAILAAKAPA
ncbi:MFS transporter [Tsuneonella sp. YG55]|uniref:MFS transporter n=1 Tax=Tsuneonella litorea TaxID=2976475 RepID=A0A9X2VY02_9SPHN|nr:MFS transporter [Tsuneonella litorea]MCT2557397.1 MFS transporter [Tsuneonella litorea]